MTAEIGSSSVSLRMFSLTLLIHCFFFPFQDPIAVLHGEESYFGDKTLKVAKRPAVISSDSSSHLIDINALCSPAEFLFIFFPFFSGIVFLSFFFLVPSVGSLYY